VSSEAQVRARLARQFGADVDCEIVWVGPYAYRSQCLDRLRIGSVFFMGDTAKIVSPFGARGGNTGVADADNLAWKLAVVLRGLAPGQRCWTATTTSGWRRRSRTCRSPGARPASCARPTASSARSAVP
jgi:2-polyprenyl-6-methoxyphenol hydroxylase-like FAD-dependent oxidoreductase